MSSVVTSSHPAATEARPVETLLGELLLSEGKLTELDIGRVIVVQRQQGLRFGEAAQHLGLVTEEDVRSALARQFEYPYSRAGESSLDPLLVVAHQPFSRQAEALRVLRSQLMMRWFDGKRRTLMITAARSGQGASCLAANLAIVFAQLGESTLLVDANFRAPVQHSLFGVRSDLGLSSVLVGRAAFKQALEPIATFENLHVLCAGPAPPNPQELLGRVTFSYLVETAPASYDVVIIDTPPVLEYADAQMIAARAGGCVLSTQRHRTRCNDLQQAVARLQPSGAQILGAVIND